MNKTHYRIRDIGTSFGDAPFGTSLKSKDYTIGGIPVIQGGNIVDQVFEWNRKLYTSEEKFNSLKRSHCNAGDLAFPKIGNRTVGSCAIIPAVEGHTTFLLSTNMMKMSVNSEIADIKYVYYYFCQSSIRQKIISEAGGGAQPIFNFTSLKNFEIDLPSLPIQRKIADVLSAYDDLIEVNARRIRVLEAMAQSVYREWFGNVDAKSLPRGWKEKTLGEIIQTKTGYSFKSGTYSDQGDYGLVTIKNVQDGSFVSECTSRISEIPDNVPEYCYLKTGDILLSLTGNVGRVCVVYGNDYLLNQRVAKLLPTSEASRAFIYFLFRQDGFRTRLESVANGVAQQNISLVEMAKLKIQLPPKDIMSKYSASCEPMLDLMIALQLQNTNLRRTRDLLLPG